MAVGRKEKHCEMCSEVKHKRFETGSDTVIHSAHINTHLSLKRMICKELREVEVMCNDTKQTHRNQSLLVTIFDTNNNRLKCKRKDNKGNVFVLGKKNIQNEILLKLPVVPPLSP